MKRIRAHELLQQNMCTVQYYNFITERNLLKKHNYDGCRANFFPKQSFYSHRVHIFLGILENLPCGIKGNEKGKSKENCKKHPRMLLDMSKVKMKKYLSELF